MHETTITRSRAVKRSFERAALSTKRDAINPSDFITHRYGLDPLEEAL
jgi:hypothetical protein